MVQLLILLFISFSFMPSADNRVDFLHSVISQSENTAILLEDGTLWRIMDSKITQPSGDIIIILADNRTSGIAYTIGQHYPVTLLDGNPDSRSGFLTYLLFKDIDRRTLTFSDGTERRVLNPDAMLDFPSDKLVEFIISQDRRHAFDLHNIGEISISPPLR